MLTLLTLLEIDMASPSYWPELVINLQPWIDECCDLGANYQCGIRALYLSLRTWFERNDIKGYATRWPQQMELKTALLWRPDVTLVVSGKNAYLRGIRLRQA